MHNIRLAILSPSSPSNTETFIQKHIDYLPFEKTVIYGDPIPHQIPGFTNVAEPVNIFKKIRQKFKPATMSYGNDFKEQQLKQLLINKRIQVVLAEYVLTGSYVCNVCKELNIPIIATGLGYELAMYKVIEDHKAAYFNFFKYCSSIIIVARSMEKVLMKLGCDKTKIIHSPAGASEDFFEIEPDYNSMQLFAIGRFVEKKSPHLMVLTFYQVLQKFPQAKLVFAGDGPLLNFTKDIVKALKMENSVSFVGKISQEEQKKYLKESRIFVQHSRIASDGDSEGTPVAIVEASSAGLPVVSTNHAGIIDVVIKDQTAFLVEEGDTDEMAVKIMQLLNDRELAKKMGAAGKENIKHNFTLEKHIAAIEGAILKAVQ